MMPGHSKLKHYTMSAICLLVGIMVIFPIIYALGVSFMTPADLASYPPRLFPSGLFLENYMQVFRRVPIIRFMWNSFLIAFLSTIGRIITCSLAAYSFAFFDFKFKKFWFFFILGTMMIPGDVLIITNYVTVASMGLVNTLPGILIVMLTSPTYVFVLRQNFKSIPKDFREAAFMDGCGDFRFYSTIVMPMSKSVLSTIFIASFISSWNAYFWPLLITNTNSMRPVQVGITMLQFPDAIVHGPIMAAVILVLLPSIAVFLIFQKQLVKGFTSAALKG